MEAFDEQLFIFINKSLANPVLDLIMPLITHAGSIAAWLAITLLIALAGKRREASILLIGLVIGWISVASLKYLIMRPSPAVTIKEVRVLIGEGGPSFPSGHSANVTIGATLIGNKFPRSGRFLLFLAFFVYFSRIYVGIHWPTDVIAGAIMGFVIGYLVLKIERAIGQL